MTSPSHKKHPTTPPSILAENLSKGRRQKAEGRTVSLDLVADAYAAPATKAVRQEPLWLPAGLLAALLTLTMAISAVGAPPAKHAWVPIKPRVNTKANKNTNVRSPHARVSTRHTVKRSLHRDRFVKPVGYDDDLYAAGYADEQPTTGQGRARMHSIVISGGQDEPQRGYRFAQSDTRSMDAFEKQLEVPFGVEELPPQQDARDEIDGFDRGLPAVEEAEEAPLRNTLPPMDDEPERLAPEDPFDEPEDEDDFDLDDLDDDLNDLDDDYDRQSRPKPSQAQREAKERSQAAQDCAEGLAELKANRLSGVDVYIGVSGQEGKDYPYQCSIDQGETFAPRCWEQVCYMWKASALCHKPLYFEQVHLERYGHSWGPYLDPVVSGAHFFTRLPVLPYCMGLKAPNECVYTLGHYRPGSCAPYMIEPIPFTWRAALFEAGAWTGGVLVVP